MNSAPKQASILKTICDGEISCTRLYRGGSFNIKIHAKLMGTSNWAIVFDGEDTGVLRRVHYCLHQIRFTEDLSQVDNVTTFPAVKKDVYSIAEKLAMFHLMVYFINYTDPVARPEGIYDNSTLFNIDAFFAEYFVSEDDATVSKSAVFILAKKFFPELKFNEQFLMNKLLNYDVDPQITYDKNRTHRKSRGVFVNMRLNNLVENNDLNVNVVMDVEER